MAPSVPSGTSSVRSISCQERAVIRLMSSASVNQKNPLGPKDQSTDTPFGVVIDTVAVESVFWVGDRRAFRVMVSFGSQAPD